MSRVRASIMQDIHTALENSYFTTHDFSVDYPDEGSIVEITFISKPNFSFTIDGYPGAVRPGFRVEECPGSFFTEETTTVASFDTCVARIPAWCDRILADLRASSPLGDLEHLYQTLEEQVKEHVNDQDKHFSREEREAMYAQLDSLLEKFEQLERQSAITTEELESVKREIKNMREDLNYFSKGVWYRTAGNKILNLVSRFTNTKDGRSLVSEPVKGLLPGNLDIDSAG